MIEKIDADISAHFFPGLKALGILRLDLPDPIAGGNKSYKLKYHLENFRKSGAKNMLSFGGAYSNHIAALSHAGKTNAVSTIGIIRGDELNVNSNKILRYAASCGMQLHFVSRDVYARRYAAACHAELAMLYDAYVIPEGGSGEAGEKGCCEILNDECTTYDEIIVPVGTGATFRGIDATKQNHQHVTGIDIVNADLDHALGGYAKTNRVLEEFMRCMKSELNLPLDYVYSGKALFAVYRMAHAGVFNGKKLLFVHTGGYAFEE